MPKADDRPVSFTIFLRTVARSYDHGHANGSRFCSARQTAIGSCAKCCTEQYKADNGVSKSLHVNSRLQKDLPNAVWFIKYSYANATKLGQWVYGPSREAIRGERKYARWYAAKDRPLWPNRCKQ